MIQAVGTVARAEPGAIALDVPGWPGHAPGQFAMLRLDPSGRSQDPLLPRPMAVFRAEGERLEFRYKVVGRGTARMAELRPGDALGVVGPLGRPFVAPPGPAWIVGGGTGIASLYELAAGAAAPCRVLLGARSAGELLGLAAFEALPHPLALATDDGSRGHLGPVTDLLEPARDEVVYACGPGPMLREVGKRVAASGSRCWVSLESQMACGFGVCLGCAIETADGFRYVCTHGPVFDAARLRWEKLP